MSGTILFVDDDGAFLESLQDGLNARRSGYAVLVATDVPHAIQLLTTEAVDLVVTDLKMPGQSGFDLLAHMVEHHPMTPSIVMTAYGTPEMERQAEQLGALRVMSKPLDLRELERQLDRVLGSRFGSLQGVSVAGFLQLLSMERSTCLVTVVGDGGKASLSFVDGRLVDARHGGLRGDDAVLKIAALKSPRIAVGQLTRTPQQTVATDLPTLLMEAALRQDETDREAGVTDEQFSEALAKLLKIDGCLGVAVLRPPGQLVALHSLSGVDMERMGKVAGEALTKAQETTAEMDAGYCHLLYLEGSEASVFCRGVGGREGGGSDSAGPSTALQVVLALDPGANPGMGRIVLNAAADALSDLIR